MIREMQRRAVVQRYVDPMVAGTHDLQELAQAYYQMSRARTKVQHSLINHGLPLYFSEMHRYWATTRNEWRFLLQFPTPATFKLVIRDLSETHQLIRSPGRGGIRYSNAAVDGG